MDGPGWNGLRWKTAASSLGPFLGPAPWKGSVWIQFPDVLPLSENYNQEHRKMSRVLPQGSAEGLTAGPGGPCVLCLMRRVADGAQACTSPQTRVRASAGRQDSSYVVLAACVGSS